MAATFPPDHRMHPILGLTHEQLFIVEKAIRAHSLYSPAYEELETLCGTSREEFYRQDTTARRFFDTIGFISDAARSSPFRSLLVGHFCERMAKVLPVEAKSYARTTIHEIYAERRRDLRDTQHQAEIDKYNQKRWDEIQRAERGAIKYFFDRLFDRIFEGSEERKSPRDVASNEPPLTVVEQHVTQIIYGGQVNVHGGSISGDINQAVNQTVVRGNFESLCDSLVQIGIPQSLHSTLQAALDEDRQAGHSTEIGPKTDGWLRSTLKSLAKGALRVSEAVAEKIVTNAILQYLGQRPLL